MFRLMELYSESEDNINELHREQSIAGFNTFKKLRISADKLSQDETEKAELLKLTKSFY